MLLYLIASAVSLLSTAFLFRGRISDLYFGEIFDTRLMIVLHEHWFRFFTGKTSFLDAEFFYPYPRSFALTDTFLLSGVTHSFFRLFRVNTVDAWAISQFIWIFVGLIGWFFLAKTFLSNKTLQILIIPLIATSFPFVAHLNERPNVIPYLLSSWVFFFLIKFYQSKLKNEATYYAGLFIVSLPLIVLTSWYAGFFIVIYLITLFIILLFFYRLVLSTFLLRVKSLNFSLFSFFLIPFIALTGLWAYIYLPELENAAENSRPISEVIERSPDLSTIFNTSSLGGSRVLNLFAREYQIGQENLIGISLLLIILSTVLLLFSFKSIMKSNRFVRKILVMFLSAGLFIELIILKFNEHSLFIFLFEEVIFFRSIRAPVRWHIYLTFLILSIVLFLIDELFKDSNIKIKFLLILIPFIVLLDQHRSEPGLWVRDEYLNENLLPYQNELASCSAFVLDRPDTGFWLDMIESLPLSVHTNTASVLGYSGSRPSNFPGIYWYDDGDLPAIGEWLTTNNAKENTCFLDGINYQRILMYSPERIDYSLGQGFTGLEKSKNYSWAWSVWDSSSIYIQSFLSKNTKFNLAFTLEIPDCLNSAKLVIKTEEQSLEVLLNKNSPVEVEVPLSLNAWERQKIQLTKDEGFCKVENDPRELHFSVSNLKIVNVRSS
jgi:hypothetical protein